MTRMADTKTFCSLFDQQMVELLKNASLIDKSKNEEDRAKDGNIAELQGTVMKNGLSCLVCKVTEFVSLKAQRDHFKLDWHRFNVKQKMLNRPFITEEDFEETVSGELSSISGSESDEESEDASSEDFEMEGTVTDINQVLPDTVGCTATKQTVVTYYRNHPKLFLLSEDGKLFTLYRATIFSARNIPESELDLTNKIKQLPMESLWVIIMTAGGHFAAAVFNGNSVVAHKTFHRYTIRAKRGTTQGVRDSQQGIQKGSAGANLRRYNEAALVQEAKELLETWSDYLKNCHKVFIRIPAYNKSMIFGGKKPIVNKNDPRLRTIPFATRRPTFKEVKRVQEELSTVQLLGSNKDVLYDVINQISATKSKSSPAKLIEQPNTNKTVELQKCCLPDSVDRNVYEDGEQPKEAVSNLKGISKRVKKKKSSRMADQSGQEKVSEATRSPEIKSPEQHLWNRFYCAIVSGNIKVIAELLTVNQSTCEDKENLENFNLGEKKDSTNPHDSIEVTDLKDESLEEVCSNVDSSKVDAFKVLNERWGEMGSSLLHLASRTSQTEVINCLLHHGADPCCRDDCGKTPYDKAKTKDARDQFRRFMADNPDAFDYSKSHIPSPLTQEMQDEKERKEAEKKKAQRKAKKQRVKGQKANEQQKKEMEMERKKQEEMSKREKRALAAEKRFAKQLGNYSGLSCAKCSKSLTGKIPFERLTYKYCSTECVRQHRLLLEDK